MSNGKANANATPIGIHAGFAAVLAVCAACGGAGAPPAESPAGPAASEAPAATGAAPAGATSASPREAESATAPSGTAPTVEMKPLVPTAMADDLRALGLDARNLPRIEKLEPRALRGVMKLMARSLGFKCADCHQEGDFAAPTRRKKIAAHMWDEFAAKMSLGDAPLFCDSCHEGRVQLLDRRDKKLLSKWMDDEFVSRLVRKPAEAPGVAGDLSTECETCHVDMDMRFLAQWGH